MKTKSISLATLMLMSITASAITGEELARRQARSIHLSYQPVVSKADAAMATGVVTETQTNSYFMILGWDCGYCGIQDSVNYGKIFIFSVWDPGDPFDFGADPSKVHEAMQAQVLYVAPGVDVARFGGEGTGARTLTKIDWKVGEPVTARIEAAASGVDRTAYTCYVKKASDADWLKIATVSTLKHPGRAEGLTFIHSFVEDFWRNGLSATLSRRAEFYDVATRRDGDKDWTYATTAYFTGDSTPSVNVDAGRLGERRFFMQTGGATTNVTTKLFTTIQ